MSRTERAVIVWKPQPRQLEFMRRPEPEALYGGAAGGGKSDALLIEALRQVHIPHYRALILRKTYPQLSDLVDKSQMYYRRAFPEAQYNATSHVWVFPSGAKIWFGSMQYTKDRTNYQGKAYDFIGFDELTHFEWDEYSYMMSRNRPTGPGTRVYMRATTNPGGIGHGWVKARFITPAPPGTPIVETVTVRLPDGTDQQMERARVFIPSSVFDNPALLANDPGYLASLASLPEAEKQAVVKTEEPPMDETILTEEERKMVDEFAKQIDLTNSGLVLQYGAGTQKKMADFSESALENVKSKDLGEVGELLSGVVKELKSFDEEEEKGFFGIFKKASNKIESMKVKYAKAETNVNEIVKVLESHQVQMLKDVALLDKMYELNLTYFKELSMYILAGKKKLEEARSTQLAELMAKAERTGLPEDAQAAKDFDAMCNRFEKKLHDLELTRMISIQTAPQIRLVQNNDTLMVEKIQSTIVNTIPLWKSQMVLALGVEHSTQAAAAQRQVTDMTNELLRKNAEKLKIATTETAKESERGIVDIETLKATNETLISTLDEVMAIQKEGREKRQAAEAELKVMEQDLKTKLLEIHS